MLSNSTPKGFFVVHSERVIFVNLLLIFHRLHEGKTVRRAVFFPYKNLYRK